MKATQTTSDSLRKRAGSNQIDVTLGTLPDSYLTLYVEMVGPESWSVEPNDDYEDSLASRIIWEAPESGDYYLSRVRKKSFVS